MADEFLNKYKGYITEFNNYINTTEKSKEKLDISFQETPTKLFMKRDNKTVYDLNKPKYKLIEYLIQSNRLKLVNERKILRAMALDYITDNESKIKKTIILASLKLGNLFAIFKTISTI